MISRTIRPFWALYRASPAQARREADRAFELFRQDPFHPSLHFSEQPPQHLVGTGRSALACPRLPKRLQRELVLDWVARGV